ncbi:MAG TPA: threonine--tRNA ligase [Candidatus Thermoplasmatota archaeon]|nr:threonine--tRNA ligase [Candidatus Thermoplasmatota archaeon]
MKLLLIHSDFIEYEVKEKAIPHPEETKILKDRLDEALTVFIAVEKVDEASPKKAVIEAVTQIVKTAEQLKVANIMVYPYAHLSSNLAAPKKAQELLIEIEQELKNKEYTVKRAPFGWYKAFTISCKGHPLSELSREIIPGSEETESLKQERKLSSYWHILTADGALHDIDSFNFKGHENLKKFAVYEKEKSRAVKQEPPHVKLMQTLEIADYEPASDAGNMRFYPKGRLIKKLLEEYVTQRVIEYGGLEVETPIMYDMDHPTLSKYLQRFPARQYQIESDKRKFFLRFAACFGQFLMAHDATISYKDLPLKIYELTRYSFRREQSGELTGLRRLRAFTMPDVHALVSNLNMAMDEFNIRYDLCLSVLKNIGIQTNDIEMALRTTKEFYNNHKEFMVDLVKKFGKPILLEMWDERIFYFILKYEFNFVDLSEKASALSTDQIDIENGERYAITFTDKDGTQKNPLILHCSPSGAIERVIYALLEKEAIKMSKGIKPMLPFWLSPTQVRFIPVKAEFQKDCELFIKELYALSPYHCIRADIDDREESVSKKIRDAEKEWTPFIIVVGEKERAEKKVTPRVRTAELGENKTYSLKEFHDIIFKQIKDFPQQKLPLSLYLSKRPRFTG